MSYQLYHNINELHTLLKDTGEILQDLYELWLECFHDTESYADFYFKWKVKENQILTIYKEKELCAMLHLNPYQLKVRDKIIRSNYIVGVATKPKARRQGLMKQLLENAVIQLYGEGMPFAYLMPAAEAIYLPYQFRNIYYQMPWNSNLYEAGSKWEKDKGSGNDYSSLMETAERFTLLRPENRELVEKTVSYTNDRLRQYAVSVLRTPYYYERLIHEMASSGGGVLVYQQGGQIQGFVSYLYEEGVSITECITSMNEDTFMEELYLYFLSSGINVNVPIPKSPSIMARILHLPAFLRLLTATENISLTLMAEDSILEENSGFYELKISEKGCLVEKKQDSYKQPNNTSEKKADFLVKIQLQELPSGFVPDIKADIADLTSLFFGQLGESRTEELILPEDKAVILEKLGKINMLKQVFINDIV